MSVIPPWAVNQIRGMVKASLTDSIVLRRDGNDLPAQMFRVAKKSASPILDSEPVTVEEAHLKLYGAVDADIEVGDEFVYDATVWRVRLVNALSEKEGTTRVAEAASRSKAR